MGVNWGLGAQQGNAGEAFAQAFQQGLQRNEQSTEKAAMAALVQNPNDAHALAALARSNPQAAMDFRQQQIQNAKAQLGEHYDSVLKGAELIRQMQPKDDASWQQVRQMAAQAGIDVSQVPQHFDQQYVQNVVHLADALKPQTQNDIQNIPYQAGGGVLQYDKRTGATHQLVVPNDDPSRTGQPVGQAPITATGPNGQKIRFNPQTNAWEPMGGQTAAPSATFP